jgi:heat shock protein HslJ
MKKTLSILLLCSLALPMQSMASVKKKKGKKSSLASQKRQGITGVWVVTYIVHIDINKTFKQGHIPSIQFDASLKNLSGNDGCNTFSRPIKIEGNKIIAAGPFLSTLMACEGSADQKFMDVLKKINSYAMPDEQTLDLIAGDIGVLQFTRKK